MYTFSAEHTGLVSFDDTMAVLAEKLKKPLKRCNDVTHSFSFLVPVGSCSVMILRRRR